MATSVEDSTRHWPSRLWGQWFDVALLRPLAMFLLSRILVLLAVGLAATRRDDTLLAGLRLWDGNWYLSATDGYGLVGPEGARPTQGNIAFFPLLPLSVRAFSAFTGLEALPAAVIVVHLYGAVLTVVLWLLVARLSGREVADRAVALFWFFPGAVVLSMVYAEPAMLLWAAACIHALLAGRWTLAGASAALAGAARPTGIVLGACCAWQAFVAVRKRQWRALIAPALAPLGVIAYFTLLWMRTGDPWIWFVVQRQGWGAGVDFGATTLRQVTNAVANPAGINTTIAVQLLSLGVVAVGLVLMWGWRPPGAVVLYTAGVLAFALLSQTGSAAGARPRFVLTAFPLIVAVARQLHGRVFFAVVTVSAVLSAALAVVYTTPWWVIP